MGDAAHGMFGAHIARKIAYPIEPSDGGHVEDVPFVRCFHSGDEALGYVEDPMHVGIKHGFPVSRTHGF